MHLPSPRSIILAALLRAVGTSTLRAFSAPTTKASEPTPTAVQAAVRHDRRDDRTVGQAALTQHAPPEQGQHLVTIDDRDVDADGFFALLTERLARL